MGSSPLAAHVAPPGLWGFVYACAINMRPAGAKGTDDPIVFKPVPPVMYRGFNRGITFDVINSCKLTPVVIIQMYQ